MPSVTLESVPTLRLLANEVICDVLLYEQVATRQAIQKKVIRRINEIVSHWRRHNPGFDERGGQYILLGHSLGAVITYDVLTAAAATSEPLSCSFTNLLTLGSPLGCFLAMRGAYLGRSYRLPPTPSGVPRS